jgi:outer membrane receptor for Fe3+-dicitrate
VKVVKASELKVGERYSFEDTCSINSNFIVIWKDETKVRIKYINVAFTGIISNDTPVTIYEFPLSELEKELM